MTWLYMQPTDVWLFRTGHPFNAGETDYARSMFPPSPLTVQGAMRSAVATSGRFSNAELREIIGTHGCSDTGQFSMGAITFGRKHPSTRHIEQFFPIPQDVTLAKEAEELAYLHYLVPDTSKEPFAVPDKSSADGTVQLSPLNLSLKQEAVRGWFSRELFEKYLAGEPLSKESVIPHDQDKPSFFTSEYRFGIGMDYNLGTTDREAGKLYYVQFIRMMPDTGLLIDVDEAFLSNAKWPQKSALSFGGEQHTAHVEQIQLAPHNWQKITSEEFKVIFLSPTYFNRGWHTDWSQFFEGDVELISAAIARPQLIGGWDSQARQPLPMHRYVPAGSVYYFRGKAHLKTDVITENPVGSTSQNGDTHIIDAKSLGFGRFAIGKWTTNNKEK